MHEAAENWATEQFPPDQRENLAGNTIWHWMVEGFEAGVLAASPSEEGVNNLIGAAMAVAWTLVERETLEFRPDRRVAEHDAHALAVAVDAYLAEIDARRDLAALRTTKEEGHGT